MGVKMIENINVCIASDDNYAIYVGVLVASILKNARFNEYLNIYILDGGITEQKKAEILSLKSIKDCNIQFVNIDLNLYAEYRKVPKLEVVSFATFYRLRLPSMLSHVPRVIYLDCDMVVETSLKDLYETDLGDCYIAGCKDIGWKKAFHKKHNYVNAGMLVFDLDKMRENNIEDAFLNYTKNNINDLKYYDQDIINYSCEGKIKILDDAWNVQSSNFTNRSTYTNNPKIIHFIAKRKPLKWASFSYHRNIFFKYLQITPWAMSEEDLKHWTKDNQKASLLKYVKHRPFFAIRPRFYKALFYSYLLPCVHFIAVYLRTFCFYCLNSIIKLLLELFVFDKQIRAILKGKVAKLYLNKYVRKARKQECAVHKKEPTPIIWQFWEQGIENAPDIVKTCVKSVEQNKGSYEHIVLSMENLDKYVKIPDFLIDLHKRGIIKSAHFSDIVRTYLLLQNGGVWMDATLLLLKPVPKYILEAPIFFLQNNPRQDADGLGMASYFLVAQSYNPIIQQAVLLLESYWNENRFLNNYFMYLHAFTMLTMNDKKLFGEMPYLNYLPVQQMQYELLKPFSQARFEQFKDMSFVHKLTYKPKVMRGKCSQDLTNTLYEKLVKGNLING